MKKKTMLRAGAVAAGVAGAHHFGPALARHMMQRCHDMLQGAAGPPPCAAAGCPGAAEGGSGKTGTC